MGPLNVYSQAKRLAKFWEQRPEWNIFPGEFGTWNAGVIAGATRTMALRFSVIVLPLHDPPRVAEDLAVIDIASRGRIELVVGAGYVPYEFEMFGHRVADRVNRLEHAVRVLRRAWTGEEFEVDGHPAKVRPVPYRGRSIPIAMGGSSIRAARQAARIADGFDPVPHKLVTTYREECARLGKQPGWCPGPGHELRLPYRHPRRVRGSAARPRERGRDPSPSPGRRPRSGAELGVAEVV
jgi:hypothetical protein